MGWGGLECGSDQKVAQVPVALVGCKGGPAEKGCEFGVVLKNGEIAEQDLLDWDVVGVEGQSEQRAVVLVKLRFGSKSYVIVRYNWKRTSRRLSVRIKPRSTL